MRGILDDTYSHAVTDTGERLKEAHRDTHWQQVSCHQ